MEIAKDAKEMHLEKETGENQTLKDKKSLQKISTKYI